MRMENRWVWSGIIPKVIVTFSILYESSFKKKKGPMMSINITCAEVSL